MRADTSLPKDAVWSVATGRAVASVRDGTVWLMPPEPVAGRCDAGAEPEDGEVLVTDGDDEADDDDPGAAVGDECWAA
jgi:hypothetical protein